MILLWLGIKHKLKHGSLPRVPVGTLQQLISDTMVRWAQESVIEDPELVRAMFVLLHRQYDGIGGQVGPV